MSESVQIRIEEDPKRHWFRKLLYSKDGPKFTLMTKRLGHFVIASFCVIAVILVLQGSPQNRKVKETSAFSDVAPQEGGIVLPNVSHLPTNENAANASKTRGRSVRKFLGPELVGRPKLPIPSGATLKGKLITGATNGPLQALVGESFPGNGETIIEAGSVLMGVGASMDERLQIRFSQMIPKDGTPVAVQAQAFDISDKMAGLKGSILGNRALKFAGSVGLNFLGGVSEGFQDTEVKNGVAVKSSSLKNALLNGTARATLDQSRDMMSDLKNSQPIVQIDEGKEFLIVFEGTH